jgi:hypothetical protein
MSRHSAFAYAAYVKQLEEGSEEIPSGPLVPLWLVVALPADNFSEKIEYDEKTDLLLAPEGKFVGFAKTREELAEMTTAKLGEIEVKKGPKDTPRVEVLADFVYLTYKAEFKGTEDLQKLLDFLLVEGMLKPQT